MSRPWPTALDDGGLSPAARPFRRSSAAIPERLDEAGVCRAAIESLAENFSDGVVAPAFWLAVGGLAGGAAYKAANTAEFDDRPQDADATRRSAGRRRASTI